MKKYFLLALLSSLALFSSFASATFSVTDLSATAPVSTATTGSSIVISTSLTGSDTGTVTQLSLSSTGQNTGSSLSITDPAAGYYTNIAASTSAVTNTFTVTGAVADTYNFNAQAIYNGGSQSSTNSIITFVDPSALTVTGNPSTTTVTAGNSFAYSVTITNPQASAIASSYSLSYDSSYFSPVGDSLSGSVTVNPGSSKTLSWSISVPSGVSAASKTINFALGSNSAAHSLTVTVNAAGGGSNSNGGSSSGGTSPTTTTPPTTTNPPNQGAANGVSTGNPPASQAANSIQSSALGSDGSVTGSFYKDSTDFTLTYQASEGFAGDLTYHLPLSYSDYQAGLVSFNTAPKSVKQGSIYATWSVDLTPKQVFTLKVSVSKALNPGIIKEFTPPSFSQRQASSITGEAIKIPGLQKEQPAGKSESIANNLLLYPAGAIVLLAVLLLIGGVLYFKFSSKR